MKTNDLTGLSVLRCVIAVLAGRGRRVCGYEPSTGRSTRVYVPEGNSLLLRYKGPLVFTAGNKYATPGHFAGRARSA